MEFSVITPRKNQWFMFADAMIRWNTSFGFCIFQFV